MIVPWGSSTSSGTVVTVSVPVPSVPTVAVRSPVWPDPAKLPLSATLTFTVIALAGAGLALRLKVMAPPSSTLLPLAMLTMGVAGGASSLSFTAAVAVWLLPCTR